MSGSDERRIRRESLLRIILKDIELQMPQTRAATINSDPRFHEKPLLSTVLPGLFPSENSNGMRATSSSSSPGDTHRVLPMAS